MDRMEFESNLEARRAFKAATGLPIRLTPYDLFTAMVRQSETQLTVSILIHKAEERRASVVLIGRATRLIQYNRSPAGVWRQAGIVTVWDEDFEPQTYSLYGPGKSPEEWLHAQIWARMAHRVGSSRHPLDNFDRVRYDRASDKMVKHWYGTDAVHHTRQQIREQLQSKD